MSDLLYHGWLANGERCELTPSTRVGDLVWSERSDQFIEVTRVESACLDTLPPEYVTGLLLAILV
jgi:hypothetical protein